MSEFSISKFTKDSLIAAALNGSMDKAIVNIRAIDFFAKGLIMQEDVEEIGNTTKQDIKTIVSEKAADLIERIVDETIASRQRAADTANRANDRETESGDESMEHTDDISPDVENDTDNIEPEDDPEKRIRETTPSKSTISQNGQ